MKKSKNETCQKAPEQPEALPDGHIKMPVQLAKLLSSIPGVVSLRYEFHVPDAFLAEGKALIGKDGQFFMLIGPFSDAQTIIEIMETV